MISGAQSISMSNKKFLIVPFINLGMMIYGNVQFIFKIPSHPHVVIAYKKMNGNAAVCYLCKFPEQPHITLGYYCFIFIPKVEHISKDEDLAGIFTYTF